MSYISTFEQNTRYSLAISILNKFRRWVIGRDQSILPDNKAIIEKAISAINEGFTPDEAMIYYFKDSGETEKTIVVQLFKVFQEVIKGEADKKEFLRITGNLLDSQSPDQLSKKDLEFIKGKLENTIDFIDSALIPIEVEIVSQTTLEVDTKGF